MAKVAINGGALKVLIIITLTMLQIIPERIPTKIATGNEPVAL
jgi:hypothetical protein